VLGFSDAFAVLGIVLALAAVILLLTRRPERHGGCRGALMDRDVRMRGDHPANGGATNPA